MTDFDWTTFCLKVFAALSPFFVALFAWVGTNLARLIQARVKNEHFRDALTRLGSVIGLAVSELNQTMVKDIRGASEDGKISVDERQRIKKAAIDNVKSYYGSRGIKALMKVLGISDSDGFLSAMIEDEVRRNKASK